MFFRADGAAITLKDILHGQSAFLVCGGPSLACHDLDQLQRRGILVMAVNNAATVVRPQLWTCVDDPANFCDAIWRDPAVWKFVPFEYFDKPILVRGRQGELVLSHETVREMPAVFGYRRNEDFSAERFLQEPTFNWGNHGSRSDDMGNQGSRSVMYVALNLLYCLGVRRVYLLGCDFRMKLGARNYAFEQNRSMASVKGNNRSYEILNVRLRALCPKFEEAGFAVFNCTPNSGLTVFPHVPFGQAISDALAGFPSNLRTAGMYDRGRRERSKKRVGGILSIATVQATPAEQTNVDATEDLVTNDLSRRGEQEALVPARRDRPTIGDDPTSVGRRSLHSLVPPYDSDAQSADGPDGPLTLEIVSHCWRYARLLRYQLSSLVLYPPKHVQVLMTVFHSESDAATLSVLDHFAERAVENVQWRWWPLDEPHLFRRAIGRNLAALATRAAWIWFCDCDQFFSEGFLDRLAAELRRSPGPLVYPECFRSIPADVSPRLLELADGQEVCDLPDCQQVVKRQNRAVGPLQIVKGDVARELGYCRDVAKFMRPAARWMRTFEDVRFRKILGTRGTPVEAEGLVRIEHHAKGRLNERVSL